MANYDHDINVVNTKASSASPATTRSESKSHSNRNGTSGKPEEHDDIISPVSFSKKGGLRRIIAPSGRDKQLMRQVSGLGLNDIDKAEGNGADEDGIILTGCAAEIGGVIAPTPQQRQLMRQVSGLGLEDPIFGKNINLDDSAMKQHASFFFEDMDINDIPEDMRDMFSLASDRTDVVEADEVQSLDSQSKGSLPPLGLEEAPTPPTVKKIRKGKKPRRKSKDLSTAHTITSDPIYVPPAPVFESKSKHKHMGSNAELSEASYHEKSYHDRKLAVDKALAAQVDAILNFSTHSRDKNFSSHSRGSGHSRASYGATNHSRVLKKGTRPKPLKQDSRFSTHSRGGAYVPSSMQDSQRGERHLPDSMDQIFSGSKPTTAIRRVKKKKSTRSTEEKKKKKKVKSRSLKSVPHDPDFEVS